MDNLGNYNQIDNESAKKRLEELELEQFKLNQEREKIVQKDERGRLLRNTTGRHGKKIGRPRKKVKKEKIIETIELADGSIINTSDSYIKALFDKNSSVETINCTIDYKPRKVQEEIHRELVKHRFCVLVTHRQMGKTVCAINHMIMEALKCTFVNARYFYVAPFLKQAKLIAWEHFKNFIKDIPRCKINESELSILLPNGAKIYILGADNPDAMRGSYANGVVLDEYAMMKVDIFDEIIRPMLINTNGWVVFISTPKGQNHFYDVYMNAMKGVKGWWAGMYTARESGVISEEELKEIEEGTTKNIFRQEYLCDFSASSDNILITLDEVNTAMKRSYSIDDYGHQAMILGVDCARFGDDSSVIFPRRGLQAFPYRIYQGLKTEELALKVVQAMEDFEADAVMIDAAYGTGVIDMLRSWGYDNVFEVNFASKSSSEKYMNKRAEMWGNMGDWVKKEGALIPDLDLIQELTNCNYDFCNKDKIRIEKKEMIKRRLGKSPDRADGLALTFAFPVQKKSIAGREEYADSSYDLLG